MALPNAVLLNSIITNTHRPGPAQRIEIGYKWRTVYTVVTSQDRRKFVKE